MPASGDATSLLGLAVELIAADADAPNSLISLAKAANLIPHQVLCGINPHIPRVLRPVSPLSQTVEPKPANPAGIGIAMDARRQ